MKIQVKGMYYSVAHFIVGHPKCGRLHGHTYHVTLTISGDQIEPYRFVAGLDFQDVKDVLAGILDTLDHKVLVAESMFYTTKNGQTQVKAGDKSYSFPLVDVYFIPCPSTTAEDVANLILRRVREDLNVERVDSMELKLDEGPRQSAIAEWKND